MKKFEEFNYNSNFFSKELDILEKEFNDLEKNKKLSSKNKEFKTFKTKFKIFQDNIKNLDEKEKEQIRTKHNNLVNFMKTTFENLAKNNLNKFRSDISDRSANILYDESDAIGCTPLITAIYDEKPEKEILDILEKTNNIDAKEDAYHLYSAISLSCTHGYTNVVKELIKRGADINVKDHGKRTPLIISSDVGNLDIVKELIKVGATLNDKDYQGYTALHVASKLDIVKELIKAGARIDIQDKWRKTPLLSAVEEGHVDIVKELIKAGANINDKDYEGNTIFDIDATKKMKKYLSTLSSTKTNKDSNIIKNMKQFSSSQNTKINDLISQFGVWMRKNGEDIVLDGPFILKDSTDEIFEDKLENETGDRDIYQAMTKISHDKLMQIFAETILEIDPNFTLGPDDEKIKI